MCKVLSEYIIKLCCMASRHGFRIMVCTQFGWNWSSKATEICDFTQMWSVTRPSVNFEPALIKPSCIRRIWLLIYRSFSSSSSKFSNIGVLCGWQWFDSAHRYRCKYFLGAKDHDYHLSSRYLNCYSSLRLLSYIE